MIKTKGLAEIYTVTTAKYYGIAKFCDIIDVQAFNDCEEALTYFHRVSPETIDCIGKTYVTKRIYNEPIDDHDVITQVRIDRHPVMHEY